MNSTDFTKKDFSFLRPNNVKTLHLIDCKVNTRVSVQGVK